MAKKKEDQLEIKNERLAKELKEKNRELEIESSLEKVRIIAMTMKQRDDMLKICKTISAQLKLLGVKEIRNVQTAIFYKEKGTYMNYEYYAKHNKTFITDVKYTDHKIHRAFATKMLKGKGESLSEHIKGKKVKEWLAFQKTTNVFIDSFLENASSLNYYWYSLGPVALGISTYYPLKKEEENLFKRFLNVFELAYRRYLDIEKAEAQARESQIQLALERVRARTMAMQKSDELSETVFILFQQFKQLGENPDQATIGIINEDEWVIEYWVTMYGNQTNRVYKFPISEPIVTNRIYNAWKEQKKSLVIELSGKELLEFANYRESMGGAKFNPDEKRRIIDVAFFSKGLLNVQSNEERSEESIRLLEKFAAVFEQTYTRFLDLQKAEASAREAEIELSLERVRAKTMAMHNSNDVADTVATMFDEVKKLGIETMRCGIGIMHEPGNMEVWTASQNEEGKTVMVIGWIDMHMHPLLEGAFISWRNKIETYSYELKDEDLLNYFNAINNYPGYPIKYDIAGLPGLIHHNEFHFEEGTLFVFSLDQLSEETKKIFKRFAGVFGQTYRRYLDLQNAEAQTKEAQIQLALERVRARTMAMFKSDELADTSVILFKQLISLGIMPNRLFIAVIKNEDGDFDVWSTLEDGEKLSDRRVLSSKKNKSVKKMFDGWKQKKKSIIIDMQGKELEDYVHYLNDELRVPFTVGLNQTRRVQHIAYFSNGLIGMAAPEQQSDEALHLLERFADVFNLTYTRFLDLQKAEAQARESQIQLALERVRARTMAMQKSDELSEVSELLFKQVNDLGIKTWTTGFNVWSDDNNFYTDYITNPQGGLMEPYTIEASSAPVGIELSNAKKRGDEFYVNYEEGESLAETYRTLVKFGKKQFTSIIESGFEFPSKQYEYFVFGSKASLMFITYEAVLEEGHDIFKRFGKVFEQTYTRFLDLQKAEAQAREAQIEAALERVRSRSMAMQKSEELKEVIQLVYEQFVRLNINIDHAGFVVDYAPKGDWHYWIADKQEIPSKIIVPYFDSLWSDQFNEAKEKGIDFFATYWNYEEKNKFYEKLLNLVPGLSEEVKQFYFSVPGLAASTVLMEDVSLYIENFAGIPYTAEENKILMRFGKVFQQTYTRFLDLQNAEAQTKEAQIQLALERVRAKAMSMYQSQDINNAVLTVFEELEKLDLDLLRCGIGIIDKENKMGDVWTTAKMDGKSSIQISGKEPMWIHPLLEGTFNAWLNQTDFLYELEGDDLIAYYKAVAGTTFTLPQSHSITSGSQSTKQYYYTPTFPIGNLYAFKNGPFPEDAKNLLKRFASVLNLTFSRFLDLQKAEAQSRESQIQLALERVRARTMAMQHSQELLEVIKVVSQQLQQLAFRFNHVSFGINNQAQDFHFWTSMANASEPQELYVPYINNPVFENIRKAQKEQVAFFTDILTPEENNRWTQHMLQCMGEDFLSEDAKSYILNKSIARSVSLSPNIFLIIAKYKPIPFSEEENDILKRFGQVFDQSYTRFLDLQKAEEQARESQIQLALERVRARTMAMQKSEELNDVIKLTYEQLVHLGIEMASAGFMMDYKKTKDFNVWVCRKGLEYSSLIHIPYFDHPIFNLFIEAKEKNLDFYAVQLSKEEKDALYRHGFKYIPGWTEEGKEFVYSLPGYADSHVLTQNVVLYIQNFTGIPYSEEENAVLIRFGKTFEQTYTRFLDLKKAEAQARESQIQLALERVRARSLAMHGSNELADVVTILNEQLQHLGLLMEKRSAAILIFEEGKKDYTQWIASPLYDKAFSLETPYFDNRIQNDIWEARQNKIDYYSKEYSAEEKNELFRFFFKQPSFSILSEEEKKVILESLHYELALAFEKNSSLGIAGLTGNLLSNEEREIVKRVAKVFEQAYIRFLDLQKAEAQAREAQIEAALERVRSRTLAMHNSSELLPAAELLFDQVQQLGAELQGVAFAICNKESGMVQKWTSIGVFSHPNDIDPVEERMYEAWKNQSGMYEEVIEGERQKKYYEAFMQITSFREGIQKFIDSGYPLPTWQKNHAVPFKYGYVLFITLKPFDETQIFIRFGKVFEQTYTRFLDLQKAEAQSRESQIEAALERVRSRTMAMHNSNELQDVIEALTIQLLGLGIKFNSASFCKVNEDKSWELRISTPQQSYPILIHTPYFDHEMFHRLNRETTSGSDFFTAIYDQEQTREFFGHFFEKTIAENVPEDRKQYVLNSKGYANSSIFTKDIWFSILKYEPAPFSDEENSIFKRFAKVFEQSYTRFLDLQKAEAQTREAQIEAALEKVRSRSLAMHKSDEMNAVMEELLQRVKELGIDFDAAVILEFKNVAFDMWSGYEPGTISLTKFPSFDIDISYFKDISKASKSGEELFTHQYSFEEKNKFFHYLFENTNFKEVPEDRKEYILESKYYTVSIAFAKHTAIQLHSYSRTAFSDSENEILKRFVKVFEQAYVRFLDLQKAEAQARESQVEASLERVRSHAMAMHNSNDLAATANLVFVELQKLGVQQIRSGVGLIDKNTRNMEVYSAASSGEGSLTLMGQLHLSGHSIFEKQFQSWLNHENYFASLKGNELESYYKIVSKALGVPLNTSRNENEEYGHWIMFSEGFLYAWSEKKYTDEEIKILERFKNVIELTFRRYNDLKKAEASTKEAIKQAALDRIRADIASMRTITDLDRITPLIWNELTVLGIPFIRCGVFIMDEEQQQIHTFLSTPDGKAIAAFHLPYDTPGNFADIVSHWQQKKIYVNHWDQRDFSGLANTLIKQGAVHSRELYLGSIPEEGIYLHFLPFVQGMLYVGNNAKLKEDEIELIQSVADAFSTAYARYEDFNKLEAAKKQVDSTLNELQATQRQLVQSEKMASLGELTAGIAHEIQNPLNFVNNFSEVSNELIEELNAERSKPNAERDEGLVNEILNDIRQNLEKINHHGKRADGIVKGMLQHSRSSSGQKELTDINALADEYLRLAYHGFRAKEKSFNAKFEMNFDESIGKINAVPQDIGRALLNLINNAFFAVNERQKAESLKQNAEYDPLVTVETKKSEDKVTITVSDNGNGIPSSIKEKIFQPFFTTKPTGQGTGLGLSLVYDIIKAHGGEIKVETKEGEGTDFIIQIPLL